MILLSNMHRILWFDSQIRENKYPNRNALAERFEISIRQAQRDIDYLKDSLKAPLTYDAKRRGYYYEEQTFMLPHVYISEEQKRLLSFLTYSYENYNQTSKTKQIVELFKKFSGEKNTEEELPIFDLNKSIIEKLNLLAESIKYRKKVRLKYRDQHIGEIEYIIFPYRLFNKNRTDYLYCYCEEINEYTNLRIDRITNMWMIEDYFEVSFDYIEKANLATIEKDPFTAKIKCKEEPTFINPEFRVFEIENFIYQIHFYDVDAFINELLYMDKWEEIISPNWLKRKIKNRCTKIIDKLSN